MASRDSSGVEVLGEGRYLRLVRRDTFEFVERVNATGVVCITAVTDAGRVLLVEQYRPPIQRRTIELVAGLVGDEGAEDSLAAARRELLEETGYTARHWEPILTGPSAGGMASGLIDFYHATGLEKIGPGGGVHDEDLTLHEIPLDEAFDWLMARDPAEHYIDAKIFLGLMHALRRRV